MKKKWLFLRWTLTFILTIIASFVIWKLGGFQSAWKLDATKITFLIIFCFALITCYCGMLSWKLSNITDLTIVDKNSLRLIEIKLEHGWYTVSLCESLGYLGTIAGLIMVFVAFESLSNYNEEAIKKLINDIYPGFQTAFITTLAGLICSNILRFQCHNIYMGIQEAKHGE
ncbi:MAG: MotA/TolQ/ExbB proton channel family protein [Patescibacteria group bacterium]